MPLPQALFNKLSENEIYSAMSVWNTKFIITNIYEHIIKSPNFSKRIAYKMCQDRPYTFLSLTPEKLTYEEFILAQLSGLPYESCHHYIPGPTQVHRITSTYKQHPNWCKLKRQASDDI